MSDYEYCNALFIILFFSSFPATICLCVIYDQIEWFIKRAIRKRRNGIRIPAERKYPMPTYSYKITEDNGRVSYILASGRNDAIAKFCSNTGAPRDYVSMHCYVKNLGRAETLEGR